MRTCRGWRREAPPGPGIAPPPSSDRKSTRLNSSHLVISYGVFCLKKQTREQPFHVEATTTGGGRDVLPPDGHSLSSRTKCRPACVESMTKAAGAGGAFFFFNDTATPEVSPLSLHDPFRP